MKRWNGWGDPTKIYPLALSAEDYLISIVGEGESIPDAPLDQILGGVPATCLPEHPSIRTDPRERMEHARGQSLADWIAVHYGRFDVFPDGVAYPESREEVRELLDLACRQHFYVIPYGGGSSVVGHINPPQTDRPILTVDMTRMNRLLHLDSVSRMATFETGIMGPEIERVLGAQGYTLGHFPQSHEYSTLGGWVAARSCGQQSYRYGRIDEIYLGGEMESPAGPLVLPDVPASAAGPNLRQVVLGSEGRMGIFTTANVRIHPLPEEEKFYAVFFPDWQSGVDAVREIAQEGTGVSLLRLNDPDETATTLALSGKAKLVSLAQNGLSLIGMGPERTLMIYGLTGSPAANQLAYRQVQSISHRHHGFAMNYVIGEMWHKTRFTTPYLRNTLWERGYALDTLETCLPWARVMPAIAEIKASIHRSIEDSGSQVLVFAHLSHLYEEGASLYVTYLFRRTRDADETYQRWHAAKQAASETIVRHGGTISHQHGVGADHAPYLAAEKGPLGMQAIKSILLTFDPEQILNPGKLIAE
jgi:alkyldihydroxyacetonephosphate synthase